MECFRCIISSLPSPTGLAPRFFVFKTDGTTRLCVDYCKLNEVTIRDSYQTVCRDECIDSPGETMIFSITDANGKYWLVEIGGKERDKTAFKSQHGLFCFKACFRDCRIRLKRFNEQCISN